MNYCATCGEKLAPGAKFCPNCGKAVEAPATAAAPHPQPAVPTPKASAVPPVPPPPRGRSTWWILPAAIIGVIVIVFLILVGMPFGRPERIERESVPLDTIGEATTTQPPSATIVDANSPATTGTIPPPLTTRTIPPTATATQTVAPPAEAMPSPVSARPPAEERQPDAPRRGEISERDAATILRTAATRYYDDVSSECMEIRSHGYENVGYTMTVWNSCASGGIRMLGRWRVDSEKGEVFRQRDDGRYLAP